MKRFVLLFTCIILASYSAANAADGAFAQGSKSVSGTFSFMRQSGDAYYNMNLLQLDSKVSTAISHGLFVGPIFQMQYISYGSDGYSDTQWQIGGIVEQYYTKENDVDGEVIPYIKTFIMFGNNDSVILMSLGANIGFLKMVSQAVGLDFGLKGSYDSFSVDSNSASGFTFQAAIGISSFIF